ncbi:BlaI/MecI/CopY family transcriptional regulator [Anaerotignum sp.]|uniref:BlaI/MecI/CopY family transcriptional regulator n=1 Tax=Anaerotignum sp. TaxID=2039241 RepID=UPI003320B04D
MNQFGDIPRLPDTELEIMKVIWNEEKILSTSEIKAKLEERRPWNTSALQTLLNRLIDRGFLDSYKEGKSRFYLVKVDEGSYLAMENRLFLDKVNNNSLTKLIASLYESRAICQNDLDELAAYIRQKTGGEE